MLPRLYGYNETTFKTLGYGTLADTISAVVTEELNGAYTLELKYPRGGAFAEYLQPRNIILCKPNCSVDREAFRICKVTRTMKNAITVYAYQLSYDLSGYVVLPGTSADLTAAITKLNNAAGNFTISTSKTSSTDFVVDVPSSVRSWFGGKEGSIIDLYGGEWYFNMWSCNLRASRGSDKGLRISYGVNLSEYQKELEDNKYAYVQAYFSKEISSVKTVVYGTAVATGATGTDRTLILDATSNWENSVPTATDLTNYATSYISSHSTALSNHAQTITITPEMLATQEISMGDTVHVSYDDEIVSTRVIKTVWDVLGERFTTVELGTKKANIAETIKSLNTAEDTPTYIGKAAGLDYTKTDTIIQLTEGSTNVYPTRSYEQYEFRQAITAGTIGTRGNQQTYTPSFSPASVEIDYISSSDKYIPVVFLWNGTVYCNRYRATASAVTEAESAIRVRIFRN